MLVKIAIGDAYGAGFEFAPLSFVEKNNVLKYIPHPLGTIPEGKYTDDTQMSIAIAELMLSGKSWSKFNIAEAFMKAYKRDKRLGYAGGFQGFLDTVQTPHEFLAKIKPDSSKNGAAMRAVPLGYEPNLSSVMHKAIVQAQVTHDTVGGTVSAAAVALMSHYFIYKLGDKSGLQRFIERYLRITLNPCKVTETACHGLDTVDAVLTVLMKSESHTEILRNSVALGGDTDSVASIALGIASTSNLYKKDIPLHMYDKLEVGNYHYGKNYLNNLSRRLRGRYSL